MHPAIGSLIEADDKVMIERMGKTLPLLRRARQVVVDALEQTLHVNEDTKHFTRNGRRHRTHMLCFDDIVSRAELRGYSGERSDVQASRFLHTTAH